MPDCSRACLIAARVTPRGFLRPLSKPRNDDEVLIQPGDAVIAQIEMHGAQGKPQILQLVP